MKRQRTQTTTAAAGRARGPAFGRRNQPFVAVLHEAQASGTPKSADSFPQAVPLAAARQLYPAHVRVCTLVAAFAEKRETSIRDQRG